MQDDDRTGAQQSVVRADLVEKDEYVGRSAHLNGFNGSSVVVPIAKVWIDVGKYCIQQEVAVCAKAPEPVLLGLDIGFLDYLLDLEREQRKKTVGVNTRAQTRKQAADEAFDQQQSEQDKAQPLAVEGINGAVDNGSDEGEFTEETGRSGS